MESESAVQLRIRNDTHPRGSDAKKPQSATQIEARAYFDKLPVELIRMILSYVSPLERLNAMLLNKSLKKAVDDDKSKLAKDDLKKDREHVNARACEQAVYLTNNLISVTKLWLKGGMKEDNALSAAVVKALNGNKEEICLAVRRTLPPGNSIPEQAIDNVYAMLVRIVKTDMEE
jgi:hypothetical protein